MVNLPASRKYLAASCVFAVAAAVSLAAHISSTSLSTYARPANSLSETSGAASVRVSAGGVDRKDLSVLRLTLSPEGFAPAEVTLPRGRFLLVVYNKSGLEEVDLRLDAVAGGRMREARAKGRGSRWQEVLDPPPGEYVLSLAEHPDWACRITVTAH
jgi:hypothetical protein